MSFGVTAVVQLLPQVTPVILNNMKEAFDV